MKIGLDATPLTVATGGIRRYTEELHRALERHFPEDQAELVGQPAAAGRWWSYGLPLALRRGRFDVFHGTDFSVPYVPLTPSVMTLHDLSPWRGFPASDRVRRRTPWLLRLRLATMVITPTEAVRREAINHFSLPADRIVAVPEAASPWFRPSTLRPIARPYLLFVGTIGPRKNLDVALAAWRELRREQDIDLVIAGRGALPPEPGLRLPGPPADDDLPALYGNADALLFPSLYEGFGLPLLEAMQCGTPVIASRDPALMEVAAGAALHCDFQDVPQWTAAIRAVLVNPDPWREAGLRRAAEFSWQRTARLTREVYAQAIDRAPR